MTRYTLAETWLRVTRWFLVLFFLSALLPWRIGPEYIVNFFVVMLCMLILTIIAHRTATQHFVNQYNVVMDRQIAALNHAAAEHQRWDEELKRGLTQALCPEDIAAEAQMEKLRQWEPLLHPEVK